nr:GNAT family N-acetyltransferase [Tenacibaculum sp. SG-28]
MAVAEGQTNKGLARFILEHCEQVLRGKAIPSMRIDTHEDNLGMQHILKTENYVYCGIIHLTRGSTRLAYEKIIV